jgi:hypothetical protein
MKLGEMWGSDGSEYDDDSVLEYRTVLSGTRRPTTDFSYVLTASVFKNEVSPEDGNGMSIRNIGIYLIFYMASEPRTNTTSD